MSFASTMKVGVILVVVGLAASCNGETPAAGYPSFKERLDAGANCAELFEIRNALDPKSSLIERINEQLRGVGCYSSSSVRSDSSGAGRVEPTNNQEDAPVVTFTMAEYRMYRAIIDTPSSVSEEEALRSVAKQYSASVTEVRNAVEKVQRVLSANNWFGTSESEIRHASDWKGEK